MNKNIDAKTKLQIKVYSKWVADKLKDVKTCKVEDITTDLADGTALIELAEILTKTKVIPRFHKKSAFEPQKVEKCNEAIRIFVNNGIDLDSSLSGKDIYDKNIKQTLYLIWMLILNYSVDPAVKEVKIDESNKDSIPNDMENRNSIKLISWASEKIKSYPNVGDNFKPYDLSLCALINHYFPHDINYKELDKDDHDTNLRLANEAMEKLSIPVYATVEDIKQNDYKFDETCLMTQLAALKIRLDQKLPKRISIVNRRNRRNRSVPELSNDETDNTGSIVKKNNDSSQNEPTNDNNSPHHSKKKVLNTSNFDIENNLPHPTDTKNMQISTFHIFTQSESKSNRQFNTSNMSIQPDSNFNNTNPKKNSITNSISDSSKRKNANTIDFGVQPESDHDLMKHFNSDDSEKGPQINSSKSVDKVDIGVQPDSDLFIDNQISIHKAKLSISNSLFKSQNDSDIKRSTNSFDSGNNSNVSKPAKLSKKSSLSKSNSNAQSSSEYIEIDPQSIQNILKKNNITAGNVDIDLDIDIINSNESTNENDQNDLQIEEEEDEHEDQNEPRNTNKNRQTEIKGKKLSGNSSTYKSQNKLSTQRSINLLPANEEEDHEVSKRKNKKPSNRSDAQISLSILSDYEEESQEEDQKDSQNIRTSQNSQTGSKNKQLSGSSSSLKRTNRSNENRSSSLLSVDEEDEDEDQTDLRNAKTSKSSQTGSKNKQFSGSSSSLKRTNRSNENRSSSLLSVDEEDEDEDQTDLRNAKTSKNKQFSGSSSSLKRTNRSSGHRSSSLLSVDEEDQDDENEEGRSKFKKVSSKNSLTTREIQINHPLQSNSEADSEDGNNNQKRDSESNSADAQSPKNHKKRKIESRNYESRPIVVTSKEVTKRKKVSEETETETETNNRKRKHRRSESVGDGNSSPKKFKIKVNGNIDRSVIITVSNFSHHNRNHKHSKDNSLLDSTSAYRSHTPKSAHKPVSNTKPTSYSVPSTPKQKLSEECSIIPVFNDGNKLPGRKFKVQVRNQEFQVKKKFSDDVSGLKILLNENQEKDSQNEQLRIDV